MKRYLAKSKDEALSYLLINIGASVYNINLPEKYPCLIILTNGYENKLIYVYEDEFKK